MNVGAIFGAVFGVIALVLVLMFGLPVYSVWQKGLAGEAELKQAEWNRQIAVKEAEAKYQSAKSLAQAEIERAKGTAEANKIVASGLGGPEGYLRYLYIDAIAHNKAAQVIYVPTEAGLPILEAGKR